MSIHFTAVTTNTAMVGEFDGRGHIISNLNVGARTLFRTTVDFTMRNEKEFNLTKLYAKNCVDWSEYKNRLKDYDVVINTVPAVLFNENDLNKFKKDCTVFELASKQCLEGLNIKSFNYVLCPALPSKYTAKTAGNLIVEIVKNIAKENECMIIDVNDLTDGRRELFGKDNVHPNNDGAKEIAEIVYDYIINL